MHEPAEQQYPRQMLRAVEDTLRSFARAFRASQMYLDNSPMRPKAIDDAKTAFRALWAVTDRIVLTIGENALYIEKMEVFRDDERGNSGLPWLLYRDGLRRLELDEGFEEREMEVVLTILHRSRTALADEDDLITLLWVANLEYVRFRNVELIADFDAIYSDTDEAGGSGFGEAEGQEGFDGIVDDSPLLQSPAEQQLEASPPGEGPAPAFVDVGDFASSRNFLEPSEVAYLQKALRREYADDGLPRVVESLFDIIETQADASAQRDAADCVEQIVIDALAGSNFAVVALALREARCTIERCASLDETVRVALSELPVRLSEASAVEQFMELLDTPDAMASVPFLDDLFAELRPRVLPALLAWYGTASDTLVAATVRAAIERAILRITTRAPSELARALTHDDLHVTRGAVLIAKQVPSPALVTPLAGILANGTPEDRANAALALAAIGSTGAMQQLERALDDAQREVRISALRALAAHGHRPVLPRLMEDINRKALRSADLSEQMAFFEAFGTLCGEAGVTTLDTLLNARKLFRAKEPAAIRACAAHALGMIGSPSAIHALQRSANATEPMVRSAVGRAMRGAP